VSSADEAVAIEVRLPQLAEAMTAVKLGAWLKREGDAVTSGEPIVEVETDKAQVEIEAPASGVLGKILVPAGADSVMVGAILATIIESRGGHIDTPVKAGEVLTARQVEAPVEILAPPDPSEDAARSSEAVSSGDKSHVTPVARKIARLAGIDLGTIQPANGSRITKADVEIALGRRREEPVALHRQPIAAPTVVSSARSSGPFEDRPLSTLRRVTAQRLQQVKQTVPHFYLQSDCRVDALIEVRARFNRRPGSSKITVTDLLVFLVARAIGKVPLVNSTWAEQSVRVFESAHIAVAVNTPAGLITPVIRDAQSKNIADISAELAALAERARKGSLKPDEYTGGTFTVSNLGGFGVTSIVPIINPPQACILGAGTIEERALVSNGQIRAGHVLALTLAADHRAIDGATGATFLGTLRHMIEDPWSALL